MARSEQKHTVTTRVAAVLFSRLAQALAGIVWLASATFGVTAESPTLSTGLGEDLRMQASVKGGLCVHLGASDGILTAELARGGAFLVHALAADEAALQQTRAYLQSQDLYGPASVERVSMARLPYVDDLVNLLVVDDVIKVFAGGLTIKEVRRVLAPNGVALIGARSGLTAQELKATLVAVAPEAEIFVSKGVWAKIKKARPTEMDDWTHYRHGPDGNMVSQDTALGPVTRLRWADGPSWFSHSRGLDGAVSDGGRFFYIFSDATPELGAAIGKSIYARDAYNGVLLWKHPLQPTVKSDKGEVEASYNRYAFVAAAGRLFAQLKPNGPLVALDAATGEIVKTYDEIGSPSRVFWHNGVLIVASRSIQAFDPQSGKAKWSWGGPAGRRGVVIGDGQVFAQGSVGGKMELACADADTGEEKWRRSITEPRGELLFHYQGALICSEGYLGNEVHAFSAKDGAHLWTHARPMNRGGLYPEVLGVRGLVWIHSSVVTAKAGEKPTETLTAWIGLDPVSGKSMKRFDDPLEDNLEIDSGRHQCFEDRGTERFFLTGKADFVDAQTGTYQRNQAIRGSCSSGYDRLTASCTYLR